ncbi:MAG: tRNA uridine-5-carboxymethylaminomethyl(34) synthesis GTPase MnmE [Clostridia bacterium]|nr:tRNA uridine-5-carboxymethylaminomethyl(34) synthesis GTPase MnmE [Clostridia bacterium]
MSTIASISTAPGIGGIGIIRMSGENTFKILDKIFVQKNKEEINNIKGYSIKYGHIVDETEVVDEVLVSYFKAPKSYTTENMCEINSHGGNIVVKRILELCLKNGANLAEPGEFTKRAFLNGRIDLTQAESVIDVINAKSEREVKAGIKQLEGELSKKINKIKQKILDIMVNIEVSIDYPEYDDIEEVQNKQVLDMLDDAQNELNILVKSFENGKILKEGIRTAIIGKPNAGKSSLLNAILKEERAIVTEYEGTTRDTIEEFITINGIPLKLIDTAGIRDATDEVEKIGVDKSKKIAEEADLIIAIFDCSKELTDDDKKILKIIKNKKSIIILNKIDLNKKISKNNETLSSVSDKIIEISAIKNIGIENLYEKISEMFNLNEINIDNEVLITNIRHKDLINKAIQKIQETKTTIENHMPIDIVAIYIKDILEALGSITGETISEDIINEIFSKFCLGK